MFRVVTEGTTLAGSTTTRRARVGDRDLDDLIAPNQVLAAYRAGGTVVLQGLHLTDPHQARLATNLALDLDQPVQVNAYLTPASARGLDVHFDYHDVFVVQLAGTKRWRIWDRLARARLPVGAHRVPKPTFDELGDPMLDLTLGPGDVLYLPRGYPHCAETTDVESSHLTIGLLAMTWHRAVRHALDAEIGTGRLTASLPLNLLDERAAALDDPDRDLKSLADRLEARALRPWMAREVWSRQAATRLQPRTPPAPVSPDDTLTFTPGPLLWLTEHDRRAELHLGDRVVTMPSEATELLAALLRAEPTFTLGSIEAGLDLKSQLVVVNRLVAEGVLRMAGS